VCQLIEKIDGAVIVTTPQKVAAVDVRKSITFCRQLQVPVLGVVENMSGFTCPKCGEVFPIFMSGGGQNTAADMGVPFLGSIPVDPKLAEACDNGQVFIEQYAASQTAGLFREIMKPIMDPDGENVPGKETTEVLHKEEIHMRIAIPMVNGNLSMHFGHCEKFALIDVNSEENTIIKREDIAAPPHQPGMLPPWLAERGVNVIIAGGMGQRALELFARQNIKVVVGAAAGLPEKLVESFLAGTLEVGDNVCDH
jgi:predicted Fe-Mo cluster-binding NifX family protein